MARRRGDQPIDHTRGLDLIAPAERLDDALHMTTALARVLDAVEILVGSNLLDADKHGAAFCFRQSTTILCAKIFTLYCDFLGDLAPHLNAICRTPSFSEGLKTSFT